MESCSLTFFLKNQFLNASLSHVRHVKQQHEENRNFSGHWLCSGDIYIPSAMSQHPFALMGGYFCRCTSTVYWFFLASVSKGDLFPTLIPRVLGPEPAYTDHLWMGSTRALCFIASRPFQNKLCWHHKAERSCSPFWLWSSWVGSVSLGQDLWNCVLRSRLPASFLIFFI